MPGLNWDIDARADLGQFGHGGDDAVGHLERVRRQEAQAPQVGQVAQRGEQIGQIRAARPLSTLCRGMNPGPSKAGRSWP